MLIEQMLNVESCCMHSLLSDTLVYVYCLVKMLMTNIFRIAEKAPKHISASLKDEQGKLKVSMK